MRFIACAGAPADGCALNQALKVPLKLASAASASHCESAAARSGEPMLPAKSAEVTNTIFCPCCSVQPEPVFSVMPGTAGFVQSGRCYRI